MTDWRARIADPVDQNFTAETALRREHRHTQPQAGHDRRRLQRQRRCRQGYAQARQEAGLPIVPYGAAPRTLLQANAKRADENILLADLRRATIVIARVLLDLLAANTVRTMRA